MTQTVPENPSSTLKAVGRHGWIVTPRTIAALVLREMSTTYGRSPGGYVWAILEPTLGIALLTMIFQIGFRAPALGVSFPLFYATGMLPFLMFNDLANKLADSLRFSRALLEYPRVTFVDALLARMILNTMTQALVAYIIFTGILVMFETRTVLHFPSIFLGFSMALAMGFGVGVVNCYMSTRFSLWQRTWAIATRPLFIISCIFFVFDTIPQPYRDYLWWNPLVHVVGMTRSGFYPYYDANYVSVTYVFGVSLCASAVGLLLLRRFHKDLMQL
ncbi:MAG: ABC transporter permease [Paracoccaceae bacterium]|jgi:capsular polysaccharide transport system permease protein|nr:ABC transporter permease [Paracoccaceae bacterium]